MLIMNEGVEPDSPQYVNPDHFRWIESIYKEELSIDNSEVVTPSINVYNYIIMNEMSKPRDQWDETKLSVYVYKLTFLLSRYTKRTANHESHQVAMNLAVLFWINTNTGKVINNPAIYFGAVIRYRFYDLLSSEFMANYNRSDWDLDTTFDKPTYLTPSNRLLSYELSVHIKDKLLVAYDESVDYKKHTPEYLSLLRDIKASITSIINHTDYQLVFSNDLVPSSYAKFIINYVRESIYDEIRSVIDIPSTD